VEQGVEKSQLKLSFKTGREKYTQQPCVCSNAAILGRQWEGAYLSGERLGWTLLLLFRMSALALALVGGILPVHFLPCLNLK
jgi:hypothetical protein